MSENTLPSVQEIQAMTRKQLVQLDSHVMRRIMADPERYAAFEAKVNTGEGISAITDIVQQITAPEVVPPAETEEERQEQAVAKAEAQTKEFERLQALERATIASEADKAEADSLLAVGIVVTKDAQGNITKITKRYQATDETGAPIGHPTHLEAKSWPELSVKQQAAHENAMRLAERIKKQKVTFKPTNVDPINPLTPEEVLTNLRILQDESPTSAKYKEVEVLLNNSQAAENQIRAAALKEQGIGLTWTRKHIIAGDYLPIDANAKMIDRWVKDNGLDYTDDNLEVAFLALQSQLSQPQSARATAAIPVNETPSQPVVVEPVVPVVAPVVAPQLPTAAPSASQPVIQQVPAHRPGVVGGIQPGSMTATRLVPTNQPKLTKKEIARMGPTEIRRRMKTEPGFTELFEAVVNSRA